MQPRRDPGIPPEFERHSLFATGDPASAERLGSPFLGRHRLVPDGEDNEAFLAALHAVVIGAVTLCYLGFGSATRVDLEGSMPRFLVVKPGSGRTPVHGAGEPFAATPDNAVVVQPGRHVTLLCPSRIVHLVVAIEQAPLLVHLSRLLGRTLDRSLVFGPHLDLGCGSASRWNLGIDLLHAELSEEGSLLRSGVGQGQLEEFLMSSLLFGHRSSYSEALWRPDRLVADGAVRAATHFIEQHLRESLTVDWVAAAAGVSARTLQASFRSVLRTTPTAYIRSLRLERARSDLADGGVPRTVTDVASAWGFTHLGRFAVDYRARFGESPSQTLRNHRTGRQPA